MASGTKRRKFFIMRTKIMSRAGGYEFENKDAALGRVRHPRHRHTIPGTIPGKEYNIYTGLPNLHEKPRIRIGLKGKEPLDYYGPRRAFLSRRAKELLYDIDADAFEAVECDTFDKKGDMMEPYWMLAVKRFVPKFNEEISEFRTQSDVDELQKSFGNPFIVEMSDIFMNDDLPGDHHAFWLSAYASDFIVDEVLMTSWKKAKLKGIEFRPIQK
jgi:hypothetical protein